MVQDSLRWSVLNRSRFAISMIALGMGIVGSVRAGDDPRGFSGGRQVIPQPAAPGGASRVTRGANVECAAIDFEGLGDGVTIGAIPGLVDVTFGSSWLAITDIDAGGSGNFANEPSPSGTAYFLDQNDIDISLSAGVQQVTFAYSAAARSLPVHVIAYDADGNLVDDNTGTEIGTDYDGAGCSGDPQGNFCRWGVIDLRSTADDIRTVRIIGTVSDFFGIDDLRFCKGQCAPPGGGRAPYEPIRNFGRCGPGELGRKRPTWGQFGPLGELVADSGERLAIECAAVTDSLAAFVLFYTGRDGTRSRVGMCPFEGGCNSASFHHAGDADGNGRPDCLVKTRWTSRDYLENDRDPNPWTGEPDVDENLLDHAESLFDANAQALTKIDRKYEYLIGPPVPGCSSNPPAEGDLFSVMPVTDTLIDPPIGTETEAFFTAVGERLGMLPPPTGPMNENSAKPCDFDGNGTCDTTDRQRLQASIGLCAGAVGYNPIADADGNGCLTVADEHDLFESAGACAVACDDADGCTVDLCTPGTGCGNRRLAVGDVQSVVVLPGEIGACATERPPAAVRKLLGKARKLVSRAGETTDERKSRRFVTKARARLDRVGRKTDKTCQRARLSEACCLALADAVERARASLSCLVDAP
jgi:hypothetical protein